MTAGNAPGAASGAAEVCPVDHKTREAWLQQARAHAQAQQAAAQSGAQPPAEAAAAAATPSPEASRPAGSGSLRWPSLWAAQPESPHPQSSQSPQSQASPLAAAASAHPHPPHTNTNPYAALATDRVVSSIPRTTTAEDGGAAAPSAAAAAHLRHPRPPVNHEVETGADPVSGNWIYPSEKMFFEAMRRKGNDNARVADMRVVVPIHNAVNERAWKEILAWEAPYTGAGPGQCGGGPRLHSFAGLSTSMSPRARLNTLLGYSAPFDRHDWVVDRCGTQVDYVIDFYAGRPGAAAASPGQPPQVSFYLDVRPKLNSWEGVKMRVLRGLGLQ